MPSSKYRWSFCHHLKMCKHPPKGTFSRSHVLVASQHPSDDILVCSMVLFNSGREVGFSHNDLHVQLLRCRSRCLGKGCSFNDASSTKAMVVLYSGMEMQNIVMYLPEWPGGGQLPAKVQGGSWALIRSATISKCTAASAQSKFSIRSQVKKPASNFYFDFGKKKSRFEISLILVMPESKSKYRYWGFSRPVKAKVGFSFYFGSP